MKTASLELCRTLFELSGWTTPLFDSIQKIARRKGDTPIPRYDLGYLLRKLQPLVGKKYGRLYLEFAQHPNQSKQWYCSFVNDKQGFPVGEADTPEDCVAKLAIELIRQKVISV